MGEPPLGEYEQFSPSVPVSWGTNGSWTITYGSQVIPDLINGIWAFVETAKSYSMKVWPSSAALGCVPFFTSADVAEALGHVDECCIVIDKQSSLWKPTRRIAESLDNPLSSYCFSELTFSALDDESGRIPDPIGPGSPEPEPFQVGPARLAGWRPAVGRQRPMLHAKMLLLGVKVIDEGEYGEEVPRFVSHRTWIGSANWTKAAGSHIEYGIWCDDQELMRQNRKFLMDTIRFSEPWASASVQPKPEMVNIEWDDDAFAEYVSELGPRELDDE